MAEAINGAKVWAEISNIRANLKKAGIKKTGKGNFSKIFKLDQLIEILDNHSASNFEHFFISSIKAESKVAPNGHTVQAESRYVFKVDDEMLEFPVTGLGSDRNDSSFALGKALTYSRRYFLLGILGLGSDDLEPDNKEQLLKEVQQSLGRKLQGNPVAANELRAGYKAKYKADFDMSKLPLETLLSIDNAFKGDQ